jgi:carbamoyltransferase
MSSTQSKSGSGWILGINCPVLPNGQLTFDGNAALRSPDGKISAVAEERVTRRKYDGGFEASARLLMAKAGIEIADLEAVAAVSFAQEPVAPGTIPAPVTPHLEPFKAAAVPVHYLSSHHEAHAWAAASQCGFDDAIVVVLDHTGNLLGPRTEEILELNAAEQTSYYLLRGGRLELIARDHDAPGDAGYGRVYSDVTIQLGFRSYLEAGKTMGLAPFGDPRIFERSVAWRPSGGRMVSELRDEEYDFMTMTKDLRRWFKRSGIDLPEARRPTDVIRTIDMDLAAWVQRELDVSVCARVAQLMAHYGVSKLCVAGGVAMNSVLNSYLADQLDCDVFVPSAPGDSGIALGAVAAYLAHRDGVAPRFAADPYLGPAYDKHELANAVADADDMAVRLTDDPEREAAQAIHEGKIIGWFQGSSEYGPRALGNRSILASPRNAWTKEILNHQVKLREWFRPYAPSVRREDSREFFDVDYDAPFMMQVARVKRSAYAAIPACIHVDGTARLQTVSERDNPRYHKLIGHVGELSGVPVVLNTSFNLAGMPIVEHPRDAIACFRASTGLAELYLGNYLLARPR